MGNNIGDRIGEIISTLKIKKVYFANGRRNPSDRLVSDICEKFNISEKWLRTGEGEMFVPIDSDKEFDRICMEIQLSDDEFIKDIMRKYWGLDENGKAIIRQMLAGLTDKKK